MMVVHLDQARIDTLYRAFGIALAVEMVLRGVFALLADLRQYTVFQLTVGASFPFVLLGGGLILICHIGKVERPIRYLLGMVGHLLGVAWAFMYGTAILISWIGGSIPTATATWVFLLTALAHGLYVYSNVKGAKWTRKPSS